MTKLYKEIAKIQDICNWVLNFKVVHNNCPRGIFLIAIPALKLTTIVSVIC